MSSFKKGKCWEARGSIVSELIFGNKFQSLDSPDDAIWGCSLQDVTRVRWGHEGGGYLMHQWLSKKRLELEHTVFLTVCCHESPQGATERPSSQDSPDTATTAAPCSGVSTTTTASRAIVFRRQRVVHFNMTQSMVLVQTLGV